MQSPEIFFKFLNFPFEKVVNTSLRYCNIYFKKQISSFDAIFVRLNIWIKLNLHNIMFLIPNCALFRSQKLFYSRVYLDYQTNT